MNKNLYNMNKIKFSTKQGRKRPLDTPERKIERREREREILMTKTHL